MIEDKNFELVDSGKYLNEMFDTDLKVYKTEYDNIFITDYDFTLSNNYSEKENIKKEIDLKKRNLMLLFSTGCVRRHQFFNIDLLDSSIIMNKIIDEFQKELFIVKK